MLTLLLAVKLVFLRPPNTWMSTRTVIRHVMSVVFYYVGVRGHRIHALDAILSIPGIPEWFRRLENIT